MSVTTVLPPMQRRIVTTCLMFATFMQTLDTTVANVCLPHIQGSVSASLDQIEWVLTSYLIASAIVTAPVGWLAGRFGAKRLFLVAVVGFTMASMLCGAATSLPEIVFDRLIQGTFAAVLIPLPQALLLDLYPPEKHAVMMSFWTLTALLGPLAGPVIGGWLTDNYGWRWVFYINVPIGALITATAAIWMPKTRGNRAMRLDWTGFALCSIAIGAFQLVLERGEEKDWFGSTEICAEALTAALALYLLVVHCLTSPAPFIKPRLFMNRDFLGGSIIMTNGAFVIFSMIALMTPYTQTLMGYPVLDSGILQGPRAFGSMIAGLIVPRVMARASPRYLVIFGLVLTAFALSQMTGFTADVAARTLILNNMLVGLSMGLVTLPATPVAFASLAPEDRAEGSAMFSLMRNMGSSTGIALLTTQLTRGSRINHAEITRYVTPTNRMFETPVILRHWNPLTPHGAAALDAVIDKQAMTIAFASDFKLLMLLSLAMIPVVAIMFRPARHGAAGDATAAAAVE